MFSSSADVIAFGRPHVILANTFAMVGVGVTVVVVVLVVVVGMMPYGVRIELSTSAQ